MARWSSDVAGSTGRLVDVSGGSGGPDVSGGSGGPDLPGGPGDGDVRESLRLAWRELVADDELVGLFLAGSGAAEPGWWDRVRPRSLGWVAARGAGGRLIGFANVAWDGGRHAFLLDVEVAPEHRRRGVATRVVGLATERARQAGCEWLHVDFEEHLSGLYLGACGFRPTEAGLIRLR